MFFEGGRFIKVLRSPKAPQNLLVNQLILFRAEAWEQGAVAVTALDGYLKNLKFWCCIFHNAIHFFVLSSLREPFRLVAPLRLSRGQSQTRLNYAEAEQ